MAQRVLGEGFWSNIWSILEKVPHALEKSECSAVVGVVFYKGPSGVVYSVVDVF